MNRKKVFALICSLALAVSLVGCRISPALIDPIYTEDAAELAPDYIVTKTVDNASQTNQSQTRETDDSDNHNTEQDKTLTEQDADGTSNSSSSRKTDSANKNNDLTKSQGKGTGSGNGTSTGTDSSGTDKTENQSGNGSGSGKTSEDSKTNPGGDSTNADNAPVKNVQRKMLTDGSGQQQDIPKDVYYVTAVGEAAPVVAMLGGVSRMIGSSDDFISNSIGSKIIAANKEADVKDWWTGDGSSPINDEDFKQLLMESPDVCFEISGDSTFTETQIEQLKAHKIGYLTLPALTSSDNIKQAVQIVADALDVNTESQYSCQTIAQDYFNWMDNIQKTVDGRKKDETYYSQYVSEWRDDISYWRYHDPSYDSANIVDYPSSLNIVNGKGSGIAIANMTDDDTAFYEFWKNAGVLDVAITEANNGYNMDNDARLAGYKKEALFPYEGWLGGIILSDSKYFTVTNLELSVGSHNYRPDRNWDNFLKGLSASRGVSLDIVRSDLNKKSAHLGGSAVYPAIVVADKTIKDKINSSPLWKAGFLDNTVVEDFAVDIGGDYSIYVNPVGFENWADGGLEAPLESYWIQWRIMGTMNQSQVRRTVGDFYEKFFGLTMSDADLDSIITG